MASNRLVIFDCDGVLVESEELSNRALRESLTACDVRSALTDDLSRFRGAKLAIVLAAIEAESGVKLPDDFVPAFRARMMALFEAELRAVDGIDEVLRDLRMPYCVASSGPIEKMKCSLRCCGLLERFENRMFSSYDLGSWKPAPDLFLHAARAMGTEPTRTVVVEDSPVGVQAAVAAGMRVFGYAPPERAAELATLGAHVFWPMRALSELLSSGRAP